MARGLAALNVKRAAVRLCPWVTANRETRLVPLSHAA